MWYACLCQNMGKNPGSTPRLSDWISHIEITVGGKLKAFTPREEGFSNLLCFCITLSLSHRRILWPAIYLGVTGVSYFFACR